MVDNPPQGFSCLIQKRIISCRLSPSEIALIFRLIQATRVSQKYTKTFTCHQRSATGSWPFFGGIPRLFWDGVATFSQIWGRKLANTHGPRNNGSAELEESLGSVHPPEF
jgi:hypothetical protein